MNTYRKNHIQKVIDAQKKGNCKEARLKIFSGYRDILTFYLNVSIEEMETIRDLLFKNDNVPVKM